eukprot:gene671-10377_t
MLLQSQTTSFIRYISTATAEVSTKKKSQEVIQLGNEALRIAWSSDAVSLRLEYTVADSRYGICNQSKNLEEDPNCILQKLLQGYDKRLRPNFPEDHEEVDRKVSDDIPAAEGFLLGSSRDARGLGTVKEGVRESENWRIGESGSRGVGESGGRGVKESRSQGVRKSGNLEIGESGKLESQGIGKLESQGVRELGSREAGNWRVGELMSRGIRGSGIGESEN